MFMILSRLRQIHAVGESRLRNFRVGISVQFLKEYFVNFKFNLLKVKELVNKI